MIIVTIIIIIEIQYYVNIKNKIFPKIYAEKLLTYDKTTAILKNVTNVTIM